VKAAHATTADDERWLSRFFIAPAMIYIGAVIGVPFVLAIWFSVSDVTVSSTAGHFVGLDNFRGAVEDPTFRRALGNTFLFAFVSQIIVIVLSSVLGIALQKEFRGKWMVRLLILLPWVAPVSLGSIGWLWLLDSIYSVINWTLQHGLHLCGELGQVSCPVWLGQPSLAMTSIIAVQVWRTLPLATVILLGGLTSIPQDLHDAAAIDGAGFFRTLFQITLPLLLPIMLVAVLFGFVFAFTDMIVVWVLTRGGPYDTTQVLASLAFFKGIDGGDLAGASAVALFLMPVLAAAAILMLRLARRAEVV
jgi:multiple sugar transport system permease protein